eukprot:jgi/Mesvir1/21858/Mv04238-RA.1
MATESDFLNYDFKSDEGWNQYISRIELPAGVNEYTAILKLKRKYYRKNVNPDLPEEAGGSSSSQGASRDAGGASSTSYSAGPGPQPQQRPSAQGSAPPPRAQASRGGDAGMGASHGYAPRPGLSQIIVFLANAWVMIMAIVFLLPMMPSQIAYRAYRFAVAGAMFTYFYSLYVSGRIKPPALNLAALRAWFQPIVLSNDFQWMFFCLIFLSARPSAVVLAPLLIFAAYNTLGYLAANFNQISLWRNHGERLYAVMVARTQEALNFTALLEVVTAFFLTAELLTVRRQILVVFMYWNYLKMRFHGPESSYRHRQVWAVVGGKVAPVLRFLPFLNMPVEYVKRWFTTVT